MAEMQTIAGIRCDGVLEALSDYLDGSAPDATRVGIEEHVRGCRWCEEFGGEFAAVVSGLRETLVEPDEPSAAVISRLDARLAAIE